MVIETDENMNGLLYRELSGKLRPIDDDADSLKVNKVAPAKRNVDSDEDEDTLDENTENGKKGETWHKQIMSFVQTTTFHGFDQIFVNAGCAARVFWVATMLLVFIVVTWQLRNLISYFISNPTLTSISVNYPTEGLQMPSIAICPLSKLNKTAVEENYPNMSHVLTEFGTSSFFSAYSTALMDLRYFLNRGHKVDDLLAKFEEVLNGTDIVPFVEENVFTCQNQFLICWFENGEVFDCCAENKYFTVKRAIIHSGPCFEFKSKSLVQKLPGPVGGFGFVYLYPNKHILKSAFNAYDEHAVHLYTSMADAMLEKNPTVLPVGYHNHISLQATQTTRLTTNLLGQDTCKLPELKYFSSYSYPNCQVECLIDAMLTTCKCTGLFTYAKIPTDRVCNPARALNCYKDMAKEFKHVLVECRNEKCKESCQYWVYRPTLTVGKVFNPVLEAEMTAYWRLPIATEDVPQTLLIGDVYYDEIMYTSVTQAPALTLETFISSIGGAMGLWTGASIITWIHLLFFFLVHIGRKREKAKQMKIANDRHKEIERKKTQELKEALV